MERNRSGGYRGTATANFNGMALSYRLGMSVGTKKFANRL